MNRHFGLANMAKEFCNGADFYLRVYLARGGELDFSVEFFVVWFSSGNLWKEVWKKLDVGFSHLSWVQMVKEA